MTPVPFRFYFRLRRYGWIALFGLLLPSLHAAPPVPAVTLRETVATTPFHDLDQGKNFLVRGDLSEPGTPVWLRVTDSLGRQVEANITVDGDSFAARFPADFPGAEPLVPAAYFIDAAPAATALAGERAEAVVLVYAGNQGQLPDLPAAFMTDLRGADGSVDMASPEWARTRVMVNLYYQSRSAFLAGVGRTDFDLATPGDLAAFKDTLALYDFDARDRDWSTPLGRRVARSFWQAVWDSWFDPTNSAERPVGSGRYPAFTFANDTADLLVAHLLRWQVRAAVAFPLEDDLAIRCNDVLLNLAAMQRKKNDDAPVQLGVEGPGAFYYGMFADGNLMLDGTGWFHGGTRGDHRRGGVFLGRSLWAVGEALGQPLPGMADATLREVLRNGLRWGFGLAREYADEGQPYVRTVRARDGSGRERPLWRSVGEHAYLILGMLAACQRAEVADLVVFEAGEFGYREAQTVTTLTETALEALADAAHPTGYWSSYADIDATAVEALARGARVWSTNPLAGRWQHVAEHVTTQWLDARPAPGAYDGPVVLPVGRRMPTQPNELRYRVSDSVSTHLTYFHAGLWMQALSELHALTGERAYARRLSRIAGYFCGNNPFDARLFTETGGVYNFVTDTDGDTLEDRLHYDLYPESTAFVQIGLLRFMAQQAGIHTTNTSKQK